MSLWESLSPDHRSASSCSTTLPSNRLLHEPDTARAPTRLQTPFMRASSWLRELFGPGEPRRPSRPAGGEVRPRGTASRDPAAWARAAARLRSPRRRSPSDSRTPSSSRSSPPATRRAARRQVALGRHDRGRAGWGRDRPRRALGKGRPGELAEGCALVATRRGRRHDLVRPAARRRGGRRRPRSCPRALGRHQLLAAAGAAALRAARPRGRRAAGQRRHAAAQARRG